MTLEAKIRRELVINFANAENGDRLLVHTERGTPILLEFEKDPHSCLRRWLYGEEAMYPVDTRQVQRIVQDAFRNASREMSNTLSSAQIAVYVGLNFRPDEPVDCQVEATWPDGKRQLGRFQSGGGRVTNVSVIPVPARA